MVLILWSSYIYIYVYMCEYKYMYKGIYIYIYMQHFIFELRKNILCLFIMPKESISYIFSDRNSINIHSLRYQLNKTRHKYYFQFHDKFKENIFKFSQDKLRCLNLTSPTRKLSMQVRI